MGKAARWLKGLLGMKKEKNKDISSNSSSVSIVDKKEKRNSTKDLDSTSNVLSEIPVNIPGIIASSDASWLRSYISETEKEQNKHAIAVAAATAAAADAAVAAAQAAVAVVRLTSQGRGALFGGGRDRWAAVKIQTVFRGFLARKALRALKGLVKIQALVRGYLVRKRATATLHSMQALIRAQAAVRSQRARRSLDKENIYHPENRPRRSIERFDETRSEFHSKRLSTTYENPMNSYDDSPKIVEIDTFKPRSRSRRINNVLMSHCGEDYPHYAVSSPLPCPVTSQLSIPNCRHSQDMEWCSIVDECRFSTAQNTPRFTTSSFRSTATTTTAVPATPARSVCGDSFFRPYSSSNFPNYMANTQSFRAKLRSHSAPKQRPDCCGGGAKKRLSLNEIMAARNSISGVRMHRSYIQDVLNEPEL